MTDLNLDVKTLRNELEQVSSLPLADLAYEMQNALNELPGLNATYLMGAGEEDTTSRLMAIALETGRRMGGLQAVEASRPDLLPADTAQALRNGSWSGYNDYPFGDLAAERDAAARAASTASGNHLDLGFSSGFRALQNAINLACDAHRGQVDKAGEPYLWHALRVGIMLLPDVDAAQVGLLHDVLEDASPFAMLAEQLLGQPLFEAVIVLTRSPQETYAAYIERVATAPGPGGGLARKVKRADLADNLNLDRIGRALAHGADPVKMDALARRYMAALERLQSSEWSARRL